MKLKRDDSQPPPIRRVIPMPWRPFVPAMFFTSFCLEEGLQYDKEAHERAKEKAQAEYLVKLRDAYEVLLAQGEVDDEVTAAYVRAGLVLEEEGGQG